MVVVRAEAVGRNAHALHPNLAVVNEAVGIHQRGLAQADAFYLGSRQHDACRVSIHEEILKRGLLVLYLYRTLLPDLFFCLVHFVND